MALFAGFSSILSLILKSFLIESIFLSKLFVFILTYIFICLFFAKKLFFHLVKSSCEGLRMSFLLNLMKSAWKNGFKYVILE